MNIYEVRRYGMLAFLLIAVGVVAVFLYISNRIVDDLKQQERERMQIWADATRRLANFGTDGSGSESDIDFLFSIIEANNTIPVMLTDSAHNIITHRNFRLPDPELPAIDPDSRNARFLDEKLRELRRSPNVIPIAIDSLNTQLIYYEDSTLLRKLNLYPYIQLGVMIAFVAVVYFAVSTSKRAEQNKVWVGLSKETAHQLGTPISSLMAWMELLKGAGVDPDMVDEMDKDVHRLSTIASRFSKIGSRPVMERDDLNTIISHSVDYMKRRVSRRVNLTFDPCSAALPVSVSVPLIEWVMENLIKNATDAMDGQGSITITTTVQSDNAVVDITDTGKGLRRKQFKTVFRPGYTTKKRGWGLGLTLAKRIIEEYHDGHIFVKSSEPDVGTTFCIRLPLSQADE